MLLKLCVLLLSGATAAMAVWFQFDLCSFERHPLFSCESFPYLIYTAHSFIHFVHTSKSVHRTNRVVAAKLKCAQNFQCEAVWMQVNGNRCFVLSQRLAPNRLLSAKWMVKVLASGLPYCTIAKYGVDFVYTQCKQQHRVAVHKSICSVLMNCNDKFQLSIDSIITFSWIFYAIASTKRM